MKKVSNYIQICSTCGSPEVARCKWVNVNTDEIYNADSGTTLEWCMKCKSETVIKEEETNKIYMDLGEFESYLETHFEIVSYITQKLDQPHPAENIIDAIYETQGTGGLYMLAKKWTEEFETIHKNTEWDGDFFDTLEEFLKTKMNND